MNGSRRWTILALPLCLVGMGMNPGGGGCVPPNQPPPQLQPLAGLYQITRGDIRVTFGGAATNGDDVEQGGGGGVLMPVDVSQFPDVLKPLAQQWNDGLAQLNAEIDKAFPAQVIIEFPQFATIKLTSAAETTNTVQGIINDQDAFLVAGDLSGAGQGDDSGAGAIFSLATIDGQFNRNDLTVAGKVARTVVLLLGGQQGGLAITVQISVDYTGQRTGDVPTP